MSLVNKPLVELYIENDRMGVWRKVIAQEDLILHNLHRLAQCIKKVAQDSAIDTMQCAFSFQGVTLGKLKSSGLEGAAVGEALLTAQQPLVYVQGGHSSSYTIFAGQRACGDVKHYVPRCVDGSAETSFDAVNKRLLVTRFNKNQTQNRQKKDPPAVHTGPGTSKEQVWAGFMQRMRQPVDCNPRLQRPAPTEAAVPADALAAAVPVNWWAAGLAAW